MTSASSNRSRAVFAAVVGLAVLALGTGIALKWPKDDVKQDMAATQQTEPPSLVSQPRPDFSMPDLGGTPRAIQEWDGKVVALNFWATWCEPCKEEIGDFNTLQKQYGAQGLQFVGVALDDKESVRSYLKTNVIDYPVLVNGEEAAIKVAIQYGDDAGVVPYTAFIDRKGRIAFLQYGTLSPDLARNIIESLL